MNLVKLTVPIRSELMIPIVCFQVCSDWTGIRFKRLVMDRMQRFQYGSVQPLSRLPGEDIGLQAIGKVEDNLNDSRRRPRHR